MYTLSLAILGFTWYIGIWLLWILGCQTAYVLILARHEALQNDTTFADVEDTETENLLHEHQHQPPKLPVYQY